MTTPHNCSDLDQLLRLIGMLGDPTEKDFWQTWRTKNDGYSYDKIKGCITGLARAEQDGMHDYRAHDFADYVLMLFTTDTADEDAELAETIGRQMTPGDTKTVGTRFLEDLRATAWRVWRDHHDADAAATMQEWIRAPFSSESEKWRSIREASSA
ncbi:hypothetical protein [Streptomyces griseoluteus]|uniref:hypothetical protein n=1 Tax=Streptomyces griseoluteus TaxID=29306 RepID=UPI00344A65E7